MHDLASESDCTFYSTCIIILVNLLFNREIDAFMNIDVFLSFVEPGLVLLQLELPSDGCSG